jgi:hypothetical protein
MTSSTALRDRVLGPTLSEIQSTCSLNALEFKRAAVYSLLMYEAQLGIESQHAPYIDLLPTSEELEKRVATFCPTSATKIEKLEKLAGTRISNTIIPSHTNLLDRIDAEVTSVLGKHFNQESFNRERLTWAAGIFHSRAIMIPGSGSSKTCEADERCEALTPLIDMLNHKPGYLSELIQQTSKDAAPSFSTCRMSYGSVIVYKVGRTISAEEQIFLNYGPKSNEDLLSHFGFTLSNNVCDALRIVIGGNIVCLFEGCEISEALDAARLSCTPSEPNKMKVKLSDIYILEEDEELSVFDDTHGDGGTSHWFAGMMKNEEGEDNGRVDFSTIGTPCSRENELLALCTLESILKPFEMQNVHKLNGNDRATSSSFSTDILEYRLGQRKVAASVLSILRTLKQRLISLSLVEPEVIER